MEDREECGNYFIGAFELADEHAVVGCVDVERAI